MAAFERIQSGIPEMDQALADKWNLIYIRFASHEPFVEKQEGVEVYEVELSHKFETFTATIHHIIEKEGYDAFYVFDCLSELQVAWSTDLMMGNFFKVTCPFLFHLDTVAFFPIIRGRHSYQAIAKIRETTQLLLDVYGEEELYVHPLKVWNRYTPTMFMPYLYKPESGEFRAVTDGVDMSRYYAVLNKNQNLEEVETDSWDRFFHMAKLQKAEGVLPREALHTMCRIMMTRDERLRERLEALEEAVKKVYASTLNPSALEYRKIRNLQEKDEQMAILVQRVSGSYFDHLFMPYAAGVGYSYSMYRFMQEMDKLPNHFLEICPEYEELKDMIEVCILEEGSRLYYDMESEQAVLQI